MKRELQGTKFGRLVACVLAVLMCVGCVSVSPVPTTSQQPTVSPRPTSSPTGSQTRTAPPTRGPSPSSSPVNTHVGPTPVPATPTPTIDPELAAKIDAVVAQVPAIRELEALAPVPYEMVSQEQFLQDLMALTDAAVPEEFRTAQERFLERIGLLPDDIDLRALLLELYGDQAAAYYRDDTKRFYIIARDQPFGAADRVIAAHEYTHALQDQHFDLEGSRVKDLTAGDAALGQLAVVEGDATLTSQLWMFQNLTLAEQLELVGQALSQYDPALLNRAPPLIRRQLFFPYTDGLTFVTELHRLGGFDAVNAALSDAVPASTEQILHSDKYMANEEPVHVVPPGVFANFAGWGVAYEQTIGELMIQVWAAADEAPTAVIPGFPATWPHSGVAEGWGGDRLVTFEKSDGRWAIVWRTAWDSAADASEFGTRFTQLAPTFDGPSAITPGFDGTMVQVVIGSDDEALQAFNTPDL